MAAFTSVQEIFDNMCKGFRSDKAQGEKATIQFDFSGDGGGKYWVKVADGGCQTGSGAAPENVDMTLLSSAEDWVKISNGEMNPMTAFMQGKVKVQGNMGLAMKLQTWFAM